MAKTAIIKKPVATKSQLPAKVDNAFEGMAGVGFENVTARDLIIPRLALLQDLSPQIKKNRPQFIKGAQIGDFCDTSTGEIWRGEMEVIPCAFATVYIEWAPRDSGKGIIANHGTDRRKALANTERDDKNRNITADGNYVVETATYFVLNRSAGYRRSFIALSSTQLRPSRAWMTKLTSEYLKDAKGNPLMRPLLSDRGQPRIGENGPLMEPIPAPMFYRSWICTTAETSNPQGSWLLWNFAPGEPILNLDESRDLIHECKEFHRQATSGLITGDISSLADDQPSHTRDSEAM